MRNPSAVIAMAVLLATAARHASSADESRSDWKVDKGHFRLGTLVACEFEKKFGTVDDEKSLERINRIGLTVAAASRARGVPFSFGILKHEQPNALALPGGFVYITSSLMELGLEDDDIAALLGHEVAHVAKNHALKGQTARGILGLLTALAFMNLPRPGGSETVPAGEGEISYREAVARAQMIALNFSRLMLDTGYSRRQEREADDLGQRYAAAAGFDPLGAVNLFEKLKEKEREKPHLLEGLFRTHPYLEERIRSGVERGREVPRKAFATSPEPAGEQYQKILYDEAERYRESEKWAEALMLYHKARWILPGGPLADDAMLGTARCHEAKMGKEALQVREPAEIVHELDAVLDRYPSSDRAREIREMRERYTGQDSERYGWYERKMAEGPQSVDFYRQFLRWYPKSPLGREARMRLAESLSKASDYDGAIAEYVTWLEEFRGAEEETRIRGELRKLCSSFERLETGSRYFKVVKGTPDEQCVADRVKNILERSTDLGAVGSFLESETDEKMREVARARLEELARSTLVRARGLEMAGDIKKAEDEYRLIVEHAGATQYGKEASEALERIRRGAF